MRINSIFRTAAVALALTSGLAVFGTAFAATATPPASQQAQASNFGPYDGPSWEAAKRAQDTQAY